MQRVQHQTTKKKKVFTDNSNSAFSKKATPNEPAQEGTASSTPSNPRKHHQKEKTAASTAPAVKQTSGVQSSSFVSSKDTIFTCSICCEESGVRTIFEGCNHNDVCHKCTLKLRVLNNDNKCCICKVVSESVIFTKHANKPFAEFNKDDLIYDDTWKIYTEDYGLMNDLTALRRIECKICKENGLVVGFEDTHKLNNHMNDVHKLNYCQQCLKNRKVFLTDQKLYTWANLMKHIKFGEDDPSYGRIEGHPLCKFCNTRFYSDDEIFDHVYKQHERCFICQKHGIQFEFYKDYKHLERHFDEKHFLCHHQECREKGFIVFENELDLLSHKTKVHSSAQQSATSSKRGKLVLDLATLSTMSHTPTDDERRQVRVGDINSSIIRFVDTAGDGYHNDTIHHKKQQQQQPGGKNPKEQKKKKPESYAASSEEDFKEKNNALVKKMKTVLDNNQRLFQDLKFLSTQFLRGETLASEYYSKIIDILGEEKTNAIFDLLVEAIPPQDENKKKALMLARSTFHSAEFKMSASAKKDEEEPQQQEVQESWPTLSGSNASQSTRPYWNPNSQPVPQPKKEKKKKPTTPTISHSIVRTPDTLWGVQSQSTPAASKEEEFPTLSNTVPQASTSKSSKKNNTNWTKPPKIREDESGHGFSQVGNVKVYKFSDKKKKK